MLRDYYAPGEPVPEIVKRDNRDYIPGEPKEEVKEEIIKEIKKEIKPEPVIEAPKVEELIKEAVAPVKKRGRPKKK